LSATVPNMMLVPCHIFCTT